jgi:hypothetical protein
MKFDANDFIGNSITLIIGNTPFPIFKHNHILIHHRPHILATMDDAGNLPYLIELGFLKGKTEEYYQNLLRKICTSPKFYWDKFCAQLRHLKQAPLNYKLQTLMLLLVCSVTMTLTQTWIIGLLWAIPTQLGSAAAGLYQHLPEHNWGYEALPGEGAKSQIINKSFIIYLGSSPPKSKSLAEWTRWLSEMFVISPIIRMTFFPVALPGHALHHALPRDRDWPNQLVRLRTFQAGQIPNWQPYRFHEVWGYQQALAYVFRELSQGKV